MSPAILVGFWGTFMEAELEKSKDRVSHGHWMLPGRQVQIWTLQIWGHLTGIIKLTTVFWGGESKQMQIYGNFRGFPEK